MEWHTGAALGDPPASQEGRDRRGERIWRWTVGGICALGVAALVAAAATGFADGTGSGQLQPLDDVLAMLAFGIAMAVIAAGAATWHSGLRLDAMVLVSAAAGIALLSLAFVAVPGETTLPDHLPLHQAIGVLAALGMFIAVHFAPPVPLSGGLQQAAVAAAGPALGLLLAAAMQWASATPLGQAAALLCTTVTLALLVATALRLCAAMRLRPTGDAACLLVAVAAGVCAEFLFLLAAGRGAVLDAAAHGFRVVLFGFAYAAVAIRSARRAFPQPQSAHARVAAGEERFRSLLELSSDWYWETDEQHRFTRVEGWTSPPFGAPPEHYVGRRRWELPIRNMSEQDWEAHRAVLAAHEPFRDLLLETEDWAGERRWITTTGRPLVDARGRFRGYCGFGRDVTEERRAREAAAREQQMLAHAQRLARFGRWEWNLAEDRMYASEEVLRMFGLQGRGSLTRNDFMRAIHHEDREKVFSALTAAIERDVPYSIAYRVFREDGTARTVHSEAQVLRDAEGRAAGLAGTCQDISARVEAEQALRDSEARIRSLNADLERRVEERTRQLAAANKELEAFSYSVSHDLQAPLRRIERYAELLLETNGPRLDESGRDMLTRVLGASVHTKRLIEDMLKLAKVSRVDLAVSRADVSAVARAIMAEFAAQSDRLVEVDIEDGIVMHADPALLRILLDNLLGNAWKFTGRTAAPRIELKACAPTAGIGFVVRDNGAGFDMRYAQKLFGAFQRLHGQDEFQGSGIGLAIVQRIVNLHGWRIEAASEPGKGAAFTVYGR